MENGIGRGRGGSRGSGSVGRSLSLVKGLEDALLHELVVGPRSVLVVLGGEREDVAVVETTSGPGDKTNEDISVFAEVLVLGAEPSHALKGQVS